MNRIIPIVLILWPLAPARAAEVEEFKLVDGDRVVLIGSTLIEREQRYGYWETALTRCFPKANVTFRNLGWSGDTVWGEARASFDPPAVGYKRLVEHTLALKPTVIFVGYGTNESFAGEAGLPRFVEQLNKLLDDLAPSKARFVLVAPPMFEQATWRGTDFDRHRQDLKRYSEAIKQVAQKRHAAFVDDLREKYSSPDTHTDNGMHLTANGYRFTACNLLIELHAKAGGLKLVELDGLTSRQILQDVLPTPPIPGDATTSDMQADSGVIATGLKPGRYTLKIDGLPVHNADAGTWMHPPAFGQVLVLKGPSLDQMEKLRQTIVEKNRLYFNRWRPQNETYLFGFRKQEQGKNAVEIPQFDPLVEQLEKEIARLRQPVPHTYQLVPAGQEKK